VDGYSVGCNAGSYAEPCVSTHSIRVPAVWDTFQLTLTKILEEVLPSLLAGLPRSRYPLASAPGAAPVMGSTMRPLIVPTSG